jgi:phosphoenolpyruvate---glycerone phosphotransferase subunit DhaL
VTIVAWSTDVSGVESLVHEVATTIVANERYFGELDSVVGDGDFGYSLARGFEVVAAGPETLDRSTSGNYLKAVALILSGKVGGTSGPIWSTGFLRAAMTVKAEERIDGDLVVAMLRAAIEGIKKRGNTDLGDKTLLDALSPAVDELEAALREGATPEAALARAARVAREAAEATSSMLAKRGRASYAGERSIGSPDAGAIAIAVILEALSEQYPATGGDATNEQERPA